MVMNPQGKAPMLAPDERLANPIGTPTVTQDLSENVILTTVDDLYNWTRLSSLFPMLYGTACCFIEFAALIGSRFDFDRFGLLPRASPRQADLIITRSEEHTSELQSQSTISYAVFCLKKKKKKKKQ